MSTEAPAPPIPAPAEAQPLPEGGAGVGSVPSSLRLSVSPSLPSLSDPDDALLDAFIAANYSLAELRARGHAMATLLAWSSRPAVQAHLSALRELTDTALHLRAASARVTALNTLEDVCRTSEDQIERRRAAALILRRIAQPPCATGGSPARAGARDDSQHAAPAAADGLHVSSFSLHPSSFQDDGLPCRRRDLDPDSDSPYSLPPRRNPPVNNLSPETTVADALVNLRALRDNPAPGDPFAAVYRALDFPIMCDGNLQQPLIEQLLASPACTARTRPFRAEPVTLAPPNAFPVCTDPPFARRPLLTATQRIVFNLEDGRESACTFRLVLRQPHPRANPHPDDPAPTPRWGIVAIDTG